MPSDVIGGGGRESSQKGAAQLEYASFQAYDDPALKLVIYAGA
jgi:hypothetical protein